jgi:hypothetical protein
MARHILLLLLIVPTLLLAQEAAPFSIPDEVTVDLENPSYKGGVLSTTEGGVIQANRVRIQAREITYTRQTVDGELVSRVVAQGDLMLERGINIFTGERLEYDFTTGEGVLYCGRSAIGPWYVGGQVIRLCPDETYVINDAFVTTCEDRDSEWQLRARRVRLSKDGWISADIVNVRFFDFPVFYLPKFQTHLRSLLDAPIQYRVDYGGPQGGRVGLRYRFFDWRDHRAFLRAEYLLKRGPAVGFETEYCPKNSTTQAFTQSYIARDSTVVDPKEKTRYRFAGTYTGHPLGDCNTRAYFTYDVLSDNLMPTDYRTDDFDLHTAHQTRLDITHLDPAYRLNLYARLRVNNFQTVNQQLPAVTASWRPRDMGWGIVATDRAQVGYLDYVFARPTAAAGFHASRLEGQHQMYRPFNAGPITLLPETELTSIFYSNNLQSDAQMLWTLGAGLEAKTLLSRLYGCYKHTLEPYARYWYALSPTSEIPDHFIFSIQDGYTHLSYTRFGIRQSIFCRGSRCLPPTRPLYLDLFAYGFFSTPTIRGTVPRLYADLEWSPLSILTARARAAWNTAHNQPDHFYGRLEWTLSENAAVNVEFRYRSYYDYLKADQWNWVLDSFTPEATLRNQGISNRRYTILTHAYIRPIPTLALELETRHGFKIENSPTYNEWKLSAEMLLPCRWRLSAFYEHLESKPRYGLNLKLGPGRCPRPIGHTPTVW